MYKTTHFSVLTLALISLTSYTISVEAKPAAIAVNSDRLELRLVEPPLPPSGTPVGRRRGAAGRSGGNCIYVNTAKDQPKLSLVPQN